MNGQSPGSIPVYLVTGFLGSGKTTLIAALLKQPSMERTAVVVNEFGAVGIDDAIFAQTVDAGNIYLLANGCLCCSAGDDLVKTVLSLAERQIDRPNRVVIETTGLAEPAAVLQRLIGDARLTQVIRIGGVVTTIDGVNGYDNLDQHPTAMRQAAIADQRIITKADLAEPHAIRELSERLTLLNPGSPVRVVSNGAVDADNIFETSHFDPFAGYSDVDRWMSLDAYRSSPLHGVGSNEGKRSFIAEGVMRSWLLEESRPLDWPILSSRLAAILGRYGDVMLRMKGVVHTTEDPRPMVFHGVQRLFHPPVRLARSQFGKRSSVVIIGEGGAERAVDAIREALADAASDGDHKPCS